MKYPNITKAFFGSPWAITPDKLYAMVEFINAKAAGEMIEFKAVDNTSGKQQAQVENARIIRVYGIISQRVDMMNNISEPDSTSTQRISSQLNAALNDPSVKTIVIEFDSPGGSVYGIQELGQELMQARTQKPIIASINSLCCSAAYWLAACCSEICITPSGETGSIGVICMHVDQSAFNEAMGIKPTYIHSSKFKAEGNPHEPLTEEGLEYLQTQINAYHQTFIKAVAKGREISAETVNKDFGEGRALMAKDALSKKMVDRIETFNDTLSRVIKRTPAMKRNNAKLQMSKAISR